MMMMFMKKNTSNNLIGQILYRKLNSSVRQKFSNQLETAINRQINTELNASYVYLSLAYHFDRHDIALNGLHQYFQKASDEERQHAMIFMKYLNKRGGQIQLYDIVQPKIHSQETALEAMCLALNLEKQVNESLLDMHVLASSGDPPDPNFCDFLESEMLQEQVNTIKEIADYVTNLQRCGNEFGLFMFDKELEQSMKNMN